MRLAPLLILLGCGAEPQDLSLNVTWSFLSGDCTSNQVDKVRVKWGMSGALDATTDFACSKGEGKLGDLSASGGTYGVVADGLDSAGVARFTHFGTTLTVHSGGTHGIPVDLTLRPKPADIIVTWNGCPPQVQLPYFVTAYRPDGGIVQSAQESCITNKATLEQISPGDYQVEVDSRAITPKVYGKKPVTLKGGENAMVDFQF